MNIKLTAILLLFVVVLLHGFKNRPNAAIRFKTLTSTIKSDTSATIEAIIERGEIEQTITILCTVGRDSLLFTGILLPNDRNVTINYRTAIKLK